MDLDRLRGKIAERGFTQSELAIKLDVDRNTINNVLSGKHAPTYKVINGLYFILELNPEEGEDIFFDKKFTN